VEEVALLAAVLLEVQEQVVQVLLELLFVEQQQVVQVVLDQQVQ
jgi:hypothetical protein